MPSRDFYADTVTVVGGNPAEPEYGLIVEAQQAPVADKLEAWPRYAAALWLDIGKPAVVVVFCPDNKTARWYRDQQPVFTSLPGFVLPLVVVGPAQVPPITDQVVASADPALAALSVVAHGADNTAIVDAFRAALTAMPPPQMQKYYELAHNMSDNTLRNILEALVASDLILSSPIAKENFAKGEAKGQAEGQAKAILLFLQARGLVATEAERERIHGCTDPTTLQDWVTRAATVKAVSELFA